MFDLDRIDEQLAKHPRALVCIDGPAGAGKTTLAEQLVQRRAHAVVIHMDDLYDGWVDALDARLTARLVEHIRDPFLAGQPITYPRYDWYVGAFVETVAVPATDLLVIEGVAAAQQALRSVAAFSIFIDVDPAVGRQRVIDRDGEASAGHIDAWQELEHAHFLADRTRESVTLVLQS